MKTVLFGSNHADTAHYHVHWQAECEGGDTTNEEQPNWLTD